MFFVAIIYIISNFGQKKRKMWKSINSKTGGKYKPPVLLGVVGLFYIFVYEGNKRSVCLKSAYKADIYIVDSVVVNASLIVYSDGYIVFKCPACCSLTRETEPVPVWP